MSGKLFLKAKNEETLLPRVLRVLSKQGVDVQELNMKVQSDGMELEIVLNTESDVAANGEAAGKTGRGGFRKYLDAAGTSCSLKVLILGGKRE